MSLSAIFIFLIYIFNIISILTIVFLRRYDTGVTLAWLLVFLFLPYIGFVLYLFFGSTYPMRRISQKYGMKEIEDRYNDSLREFFPDKICNAFPFNEVDTKNYIDMIQLNSRNSMSYYTQDNTVELLIDAENKFSRMLKEIENAKESIHVLYFIIRTKDQIGRQFVSLLAKKAREGVQVVLIYDGIGCLKTHMHDFHELKEAGGQVYRYLPSMLDSLLNINYRMHRKIVIVDKQAAYTGGLNVGDEYFGMDRKHTLWRDTSIRLTGSSVQILQMRFLADLIFLQNLSHKHKYEKQMESRYMLESMHSKQISNGTTGIQIVSSGPGDRYEAIKDGYVKMITSAKKYLYIQTPYFVPDQTILDSLRIAANSGVDVRIMVPGIPDKRFVYYITLSYLEELLGSGIKVYLHTGFIHAKTFVIDDHVASIGTTNLDIRSFRLDYEVNAFLYDHSVAVECREVFLKDIKACRELELESYANRGLWSRFCESLCRLVAPLV